MPDTHLWREMGPHRGGRVVAVAGDPVHPLTFYFGACSGGVWKTDDAGITWRNVSDGYFRTAPVGALAVAASDPNVVYAGMGEACIRGNVSHGDGVYRSVDAGRTWRHLGLDDTRHIARVRVHPTDPDLVYVAAFGHAFGPNAERGVYRSKDGGRNWERVLHRDPRTGCADLVMDATNPRILYAALWEAQRYPWALSSGGPGSGIFKSVDGGDTWHELTQNPGLPQGLKGRIGVAVSPARPSRVWAIIEATDGGLFRSDDAGGTWRLVSADPDLRQRPWYYMHIFADPRDAERVYVLNLGMHVSDDGGHSFRRIPTPHGDNHDLWIDPADPARMVEGNDGGACVSQNGGRTWSPIDNQPTAQFYHVITDSRFPYRIYGAQQDNSTLSVPSRSDRGVIALDDCYPVGGGESGYIAVREDNPDIAFAGSYASRMTRYNHASGQARDITVWPDDPIGFGAGEMKYRFQWTFPIVLSPHDPGVLYVAGNRLFRSTDEGGSFTPISPDLTRADPETLRPSGGPITKDNVSTEFYGTIFAFAESPVTPGVLWAGSDDGLLHVSRDGGASWQNVTPAPDLLPEWALISIVEASPHDAAVAYVAATRYKLDDFRPYLLKTADYGQSWQAIVQGIPEQEFTRAIREDPVRRGLLYCGTEAGVHVSEDDGANWRPLRGNLPVVPVHDLAVKDGDLIAATHGRSFWVLDDLTPLRQPAPPAAPAHLFPPRAAYRFQTPRRFPAAQVPGEKAYLRAGAGSAIGEVEVGPGGPVVRMLTAGQNPPTGVVVRYALRERPQAPLTLAFVDGDGALIKRFSSSPPAAAPGGRPEPALPAAAGLNRFIWNMRYPDGLRLPDGVLSAYWGGSTIGPVAPPGTYRARLEVSGHVVEQPFEIRKDPRVEASAADLRAQFDLLLAIRDKLTQVHTAVLRIRGLRGQIEGWSARADAAGERALVEEAGALLARLGDIEGELCQAKARGRADSFNYPPKVNSKLASLQSTVAFADAAPTRQCYEVFEELAARADRQLGQLGEVVGGPARAFADRLRAAGLPLLDLPPAGAG